MAPADGDDVIKRTSEALATPRATPGVAAASAQMLVPANLKYHNKKGYWEVLAVSPQDEASVTIVSTKMTSGSYLDKNDIDQIILGRDIAGGHNGDSTALSLGGVKVGDKITLTFDSLAKDFTVKGIFYAKFVDTDQRAFITQKALHELNPSLDNLASSIIIKTLEKGDEPEVIDQLKKTTLKGNFYTWEEVAGLMSSIADSFISINVILSTVAVLIAAITIFIVIYIDLINKRQQIGILRAIGIRPYLIQTAYVLQSAIYSVSGVILGTGIFYGLLVPYFNIHPFSLPIGDASLIVNPADFTIRAEAIMWVAIAAGLIPAILITRSKILEAIRGK
jgi:putative ABC transport system permease protein